MALAIPGNIVLLPVLFMARTRVEATSTGFVVQSRYRRMRVSWSAIEQITIE